MEEASAMDAVPPWLDQVVGHAAPMPQSPASWSGEALVPEPEVPPAATASDDVDASAAGPTPPLEPPQVDPREPTIAIPRPEAAASSRLPSPPRAAAERAADEVSVRQQNLFGAGLEEDLVQEAIELVLGSRRATASLLQRKLRIDYEMACRLLVELAARGIIALDADAAQGRVIG
jgi:DNA segregation ATPase FtsK/SpoIIIE-like protein